MNISPAIIDNPTVSADQRITMRRMRPSETAVIRRKRPTNRKRAYFVHNPSRERERAKGRNLSRPFSFDKQNSAYIAPGSEREAKNLRQLIDRDTIAIRRSSLPNIYPRSLRPAPVFRRYNLRRHSPAPRYSAMLTLTRSSAAGADGAVYFSRYSTISIFSRRSQNESPYAPRRNRGKGRGPTKLHVNFLSCLRSIVSAASGFIAAYEVASSSMIGRRWRWGRRRREVINSL